MTRWEHKCVSVWDGYNDAYHEIEREAENGWQIAAAIRLDSAGRFDFWMKRPINPPKEGA